MARLSGGGQRTGESRGDDPPEGLFAVGVFGLVLAAIGRALGGQGGIMLAEIGCVTTGIGAAIFGILLARKLWRGDEGRG